VVLDELVPEVRWYHDEIFATRIDVSGAKFPGPAGMRRGALGLWYEIEYPAAQSEGMDRA